MKPNLEDYTEFNVEDRIDLVHAFGKYLIKCAINANRIDVIPDVEAHIAALDEAHETAVRELELLASFIDHELELTKLREAPAGYILTLLLKKDDGTFATESRNIMVEHKDEVLIYLYDTLGPNDNNFLLSEAELEAFDVFITNIRNA